MDLKVAVIQAIPNYNYKEGSAPKEGSRKKGPQTSFQEILKNVMKQN